MANLREFCQLLENCAVRLEEEIRSSIEICRKSMMTNEFTDTKLALEKAKDYHSKEIVTILSGIITNIKQIIYHEGKIRQLNDKEKLSDEELNRYSYVKRQVSAFSGGEKVVRRELRRSASETSVYCLDTWETFLDNEDMKQKTLCGSNSLPNINVVSKRNSIRRKRKEKKFISSTFQDILEDDEGGFKVLDILTEEPSKNFTETSSKLSKSTPDINYNITVGSYKSSTNHQEFQETEHKNNPIHGNITQTEEPIIRLESDIFGEFDTKPKIVGYLVS